MEVQDRTRRHGIGANSFSASNCARPAVKFWMAPFVVAYASNVGFGLSELIEAVLIMELPGFIWGTAAFTR